MRGEKIECVGKNRMRGEQNRMRGKILSHLWYSLQIYLDLMTGCSQPSPASA